ncbi:glycosyltransferase [Candidatus Dojkabacteria bacterium]|nr:glycosyltransferase [Candidatus Dojkabacteria bacterium]
MKKLTKKILITGGGSGGHVSVATALIDALSDKYSEVKENILYVGSDLGMVGEKNGVSIEQRRMEDRDIPFVTLRAGKLQRRLEMASIRLLFRTVLGVKDAFDIVKKFKPDIIFCTGGYLSVPIALAGWAGKIPIFLHEQTAAVGLSNGFVAKVAKKVYTTFKSSEKYFPKGKVQLTGNIVRDSIFKVTTKGELANAVEIMKLKNLPIIYFSGGGQGSHILNTLVRDMMKYALMDYQIILQTGDNNVLKDYDVLSKDWKKLPAELRDRIYVTKFVKDSEIGMVFNSIDMYVGRAGANTVYELGVLKIPSIFIPIPWVTHNEQELNARILESYGLAEVLLEGEATANKLHSEIKSFLKNINNREIDVKGLEKEFSTDAKSAILKDMLGE